MTRHIVARTSDIPPGGNKVVGVDGRDIVVFHVNGEFFALLNRCPHEGAPLEKAACVARLTSPEPGVYQRSRVGELIGQAFFPGPPLIARNPTLKVSEPNRNTIT
jgi:3-phenylpropionate/trans-cinnamate dioxygenase ferredoxin subunit